MFQKVFNLVVTGLGLQKLQQQARVRPNPLPFELVNSTCVENYGSLSLQERRICADIQPLKPILLDFVAPLCGYTIDCSQDPLPIPDHCPVAVQAGVLSRLLMEKTLQRVVLGSEWQPMNATLTCLHDMPAISAQIQSLDIEFHRAYSEWNFQFSDTPWLRHGPAPPELITHTSKLFLDVIHSMSNLTFLAVRIPNIHPHNASFNLGIGNVTNPATRNAKLNTLSLGPGTDMLMPHFPHVRTVDMYDHAGLWLGWENRPSFKRHLDALNKLEDLESVHIIQHSDSATLSDVVHSLPDIRNLTLSPRLELKGAMPYLQNLTKLQHLALPYVAQLRIGFDPPWCGNAYMDDPTLEDRVHAESLLYIAKGHRLICKGLWNLDLKTAKLGSVAINMTSSECLEWKAECQKNATECMKNEKWDDDIFELEGVEWDLPLTPDNLTIVS